MTKFTKEQLQQIADTDHVQCGDAAAMARQLLASMEQEPVYQVLENESWTDYSKEQLDILIESKPSTLFRVAYAAPQLPQPAVPEELESTSGSDYDDYYCDGWNACRAAILKGAEPVSQPYKLRDGWVAVPVEPTPEMQSAAAGAIRFDTTVINKLWTGNAVYKAMLAAAPQQEAKSGR